MLPFAMDPIYLLILGFGALLSFGATFWVKAAFARARQVPTARGLSGADVAQAILAAEGIRDVQVVEHQGFLSDHYNPGTKTLALSPDVYHGRHAAAAGIAAHEVGHALQHAHGYAALGLRSVLVLPANLGSMLGPLLVILGIGMGAAEHAADGRMLAIAGVILFGAGTLFTLVTLPVEFDASARAKRILGEMRLILPGEEAAAVRGVLGAAAMTYVAAAITAVLQLLYWAWRAGLIGGQQRRE